MASLLSVNVGLPHDVSWHDRTVHTGIWKTSVPGPRLVRRLNIDGDGQGDLGGHGGEQRAVLVYQIESYRYWQNHFDRDDFVFGQFGENFTVSDLGDDDVCIGDRYRIGDAEFEVTQPRVTCFRVGMRMGEPELPALLVAHHRPGFYLRVITEGHVEAGMQIVRTRVGPHALSIADADALLYLPDRDVERLRAAVDIPALSPGWVGSFRELIARADSDAPAAAPVAGRPAWPGFRPLRVIDVVAESPSVTSLYLAPDDDDPLPQPQAGQYLTIRAADAAAPAPVRSYSLSSAPTATTYRISVKREAHGVVSSYLHEHARRGSTLDVAAPRGDFVLRDGDGPVLLISAGVGVTPVLAMLHQLVAAADPREVWWIHTAREPDQDAFVDEAHRLIGSLARGHERIFYTASAGTITPGRLTRAALADLHLPADSAAYLCGPTAFMTDLREALIGLGIASERVYTEVFGARAAVNPGIVDTERPAPHPPTGPPGTGPRITFARSGLTISWSERYADLLTLADDCDVPTRWSCRTGVCHTCVTPLLSGAVSYDPEPLERPADDDVLICCARPTGDTVLDL